MCEANATALYLAIEDDFKKDFGVTLGDENFTLCEDGYEIEYCDYDLGNLEKYEHNPLVESYHIDNDGRTDFIEVYTYLTYEDYFDGSGFSAE